MTQPRFTRRAACRALGSGTAAGAVAAAAALSGCAGKAAASPAQAAPLHAPSATTSITFAPNWQGVTWNATAQSLCQQFVDAQFTAKHPGTAVKVVPSTQSQSSQQIAATIAGSDFVDVFNDCCADLPGWVSSGLMLPLEDRLRTANIDLTQWSRLRMQGLNFFGHQYAIPAYDGPEVMVYRQDMLDAFGLPYPDPQWDYKAAEQLWHTCSRTVNGKQVYGVSLDILQTNSDYLFHGWGGSLFNQDHTVCLIDSPECIAAGQWLFSLIWDKVAAPSRDQVNGLVSGKDVFSVCGGWNTFTEATTLGAQYKWNILPQPTLAKGPAAMVNSDFYAINAHTAQPDLAWAFFQWLVADPAWTRFVMRATLISPALISLWDEWTTAAQQVAPTLQGKDLQYYKEAALSGYEVPQSFFLYSGSQAGDILAQWWQQLVAQKVSVPDAFRQIAAQINALEQVSKSATTRTQVAESRFPTSGPPIAVVPAGV